MKKAIKRVKERRDFLQGVRDNTEELLDKVDFYSRRYDEISEDIVILEARINELELVLIDLDLPDN